MKKAIIIGTVGGAILGASCFGSIAAVTPGSWTVLEAAIIGFWSGIPIGAFFAGMSQI